MLNRFKHIVDNLRGLINDDTWSAPSAKMLLAVSGGMDSMCLADLYLKAFGEDSFAMAHCNFHLRGEESDGDEALVTRWAEEHGVILHRIDFDTEEYALSNGISIEMAARELRYGWFDGLCREYGYAAVVVAHHADDNAETLVLNMLRGTGLRGMSGMKEMSSLPYGTAPLLRPLLGFTRKQIEGHVFANKVPYRNDSTNSSVEYRRNSIRHEVFPVFERMNPSYVRTLNREMTYLSDAYSIVDQWCKDAAGKVVLEDSTPGVIMRISVSALLSQPQWRYLLYYLLEPYGFNATVLESVENLLTSSRTVAGKRFESQGHVVLTRSDALIVAAAGAGSVDEGSILVPSPGRYELNGVEFVVEAVSMSADISLKQPAGVQIFDADRLSFPFVCRTWKNGDWLLPLGMRGKKKVSDLFTDLKYDALRKASALVVLPQNEEQHVAAVLGVRIDDGMKVTPSTRSIIRITLI